MSIPNHRVQVLLALENDDVVALKRLIKIAPPKYKFSWSEAFVSACKDGRLSCVDFIAKNAPNLKKSQTQCIYTGFYEACVNGHLEIVKYLMDNEHTLIKQNKLKDWYIIDAFSWTASRGFTDIVKLFIERASNNCKNIDSHELFSNTLSEALLEALHAGHVETSELLLQHGAKYRRPTMFISIGSTRPLLEVNLKFDDMVRLSNQYNVNFSRILVSKHQSAYGTYLNKMREVLERIFPRDIVRLLIPFYNQIRYLFNKPNEELRMSNIFGFCYTGFDYDPVFN